VELDKQQKEAYKQQQARSAEQQGKVTNIQALVDRLADLEQQEVSVLAAIGRAENAQTIARRKWVDGQNNQQYTDPAEANLPLLRGRLENVRSEKERVRRELERAQH
jgi:ABC-type phosphate transport system auxiliary subunit